MKLALLAAVSLLALAFAAPTAAAWLPVCHEKDVGALNTNVHVMLTCGLGVTVTHCPPAGDGPCRAIALTLP